MEPSSRMFEMVTGYWATQIIGVIARLGIADALAGQPRRAADLAPGVGADAEALHRVLRAAVALGVLELDASGRFSLTSLGSTLRSDVPGSMRDMAIMQAAPGHWLSWGRLDHSVRTGKPAAPEVHGCEIWEYYGAHPEEEAAFSGAMANLSALVAAGATAIVPAEGKHIVDVGGAHGALLAAFLTRYPTATGIVLDLPSVAERARALFEAQGLTGRAECVGGDFFASVPAGDVYLLKHILHDWSDSEATLILSRCAQAARPGARLVVAELLLGIPGGAPLMDINMLVHAPGRERNETELTELFASSGWKHVKTTAIAPAGFAILEGELS